MKSFVSLILCACLLFLLGCDDDSYRHAHSDYSYDHHAYPDLRGFNIIDSNGLSSELAAGSPLIIDPAINSGMFEFYWYVDSHSDYYVALYVNDSPSLNGSTKISDDICGYTHSCDESGLQICEYSNDFYLGCGIDSYDVERNAVDVAHLLTGVPDTLYFTLEVCDLFATDCEISSLPVQMY